LGAKAHHLEAQKNTQGASTGIGAAVGGVLGAAIGFALGGPVGAGFGAFLGGGGGAAAGWFGGNFFGGIKATQEDATDGTMDGKSGPARNPIPH
jgi:hypothetical protein